MLSRNVLDEMIYKQGQILCDGSITRYDWPFRGSFARFVWFVDLEKLIKSSWAFLHRLYCFEFFF
jgi:hypothetical protein